MRESNEKEKRLRFKVINHGGNNISLFFDKPEDTAEMDYYLLNKFPEIRQIKGFEYTSGFMCNIHIYDEMAEFWSDNISKYVHDLEETSQENLVFEFVIDNNNQLVISSWYRGD